MVVEKGLNSRDAPIDVQRERVLCALCGNDDTTLLFEVSGHQRAGIYVDGVFRQVAGQERIVRCRVCGLVYVNPRLALAPNIMTYSAQDELAYFRATRADRYIGNECLLAQMEGLLDGPGRLLDVGFGDGLLLQQALARRWEPWGLEVSDDLLARVRAETGLAQVFQGQLREADYPSAHFDATSCINVIEHVRSPTETMAEIARITRPGGVVAVHTPNLNSFSARFRRASWHHLEPFEHFYYFNAKTLGRLLEQSGLVVIGSFVLHGSSRLKRWILATSHRLGLKLGNGLGLMARRPA